MKKYLFSLVLMGTVIGTKCLMAQTGADTSYWNQQGKAGITFSQVGFSNWSGGGEPSISFNGMLNYAVNFEKDDHLWQTQLDAGYGAQRLGGEENQFRKTDDKLVIVSRYGYKVAAKWYVSALADFRTQFYDGYKFEEDTSIFISAFMAPAYLKLGLGITFKETFSEKESFTATFNPVNGKAIIVLDDSLSADGAYGVDPGKKIRNKFGADLLIAFNKELVKNVTINTRLGFFSAYENLGTFDVNWDLDLWFRINEYLSANISTQLIYDQDITFINDEGAPYNSAVQFKEVVGLGLTFSF